MMQVRLWGVRGSIATPMTSSLLRDKARALLSEATPADLQSSATIDAYLDRSNHAWTYGGNTSCVEVSFPDVTYILDAGTGVRALGLKMAVDGRAADPNHQLHFFFTHFHWDHICGFPFFGPLYQPGRKIDIWSGRSDSHRLLQLQMSDAHFPVKWEMLKSVVSCHQLSEDATSAVGGAEVQIMSLIHPDKAYGYRITRGGRAVCYLTDTEVSKNPSKVAEDYANFVRGADVVIVDAMYGFLDYHDKINFGHSTIFNFIDFFKDVELGELVIFHHDPMANDAAVSKLWHDAKRYADLVAPQAKWKLSAAREGQEWRLDDRR